MKDTTTLKKASEAAGAADLLPQRGRPKKLYPGDTDLDGDVDIILEEAPSGE